MPVRSDQEIAAEMRRNYRWNFGANLLDGVTFWFGYSFASASTILPLFVSKLTPNPLAIGLLAVLAQAGWSIPQLFSAHAVERLARKKPVIVNLGFFMERVPIWLLVAGALLASRSPGFALVVFFIGFAWHNLGAGVVATAWQDLIARCFPVERRGRVMGVTFFAGTGVGAIGSALSAWLLKSFAYPVNFVYIFLIAAAAITVSWLFLALVREPVQPLSAPPQSQRQFWAGLVTILQQDNNFRRFLIGRMILALGGMASGFVTVAAVARWNVADSTVGIYTGALLVGQTIGNLVFGWLADRLGHKFSLELGAFFAFAGYALAALAPAPGWFFVVFVLMGVATGAIIVSGILVVLEFCEPGRRPTYIGMANTGVGFVSIGAPLLGAWLASVDYGWLFAASAVVDLLALMVLRWWVQEPRWVEVGAPSSLESGMPAP